MADISKIKIGDTTYDVKDEVARGGVETVSVEMAVDYETPAADTIELEGTPKAVLNCWTEYGPDDSLISLIAYLNGNTLTVKAWNPSSDAPEYVHTIYIDILY